MMVGKRFYSEADMMRMQRDAEERVREMQQRARQTAREMEGDTPPMPSFANPNRNWSPNPNGRNAQQNRGMNRNHGQQQGQQGQPPQNPGGREAPQAEPRQEHIPPTEGPELAPPAPRPAEPAAATTLVEDIVGRLGLESDTLLIIGLLLILINQKADTTLILALVYLLF